MNIKCSSSNMIAKKQQRQLIRCARSGVHAGCCRARSCRKLANLTRDQGLGCTGGRRSRENRRNVFLLSLSHSTIIIHRLEVFVARKLNDLRWRNVVVQQCLCQCFTATVIDNAFVFTNTGRCSALFHQRIQFVHSHWLWRKPLCVREASCSLLTWLTAR